MKPVKLGDIFEFRNGRSFKKSEWRTQGLPIIRIQNLNDKAAGFNYFDGDYDNKIEVNKGDLLFSWSGTVGTSFGPHVWDRDRGVLNQHIFKLTKKVAIEDKYSFYALKEITAEIEKQTHGAGGLVHVTKEKLNKFTIPLPIPNEQRRIVKQLDAGFEKIDRAIELTEQNKRNCNNLFLQNSREILVNAEGEDKKVEDILRLEYGKPLAKDDRKPDGSFAAYGANGVKDRTDKYYWDIPSIIVGRKGSAGELTRVNEPFWPLDVTYYVTHDTNETNIDYIFSILESLNLPSYARGVKPGINRNDIYALDVVLPKISDQVILADKIEMMRKQTDELSKLYANKLKHLKSLKQSLLSAAFSESDVK